MSKSATQLQQELKALQAQLAAQTQRAEEAEAVLSNQTKKLVLNDKIKAEYKDGFGKLHKVTLVFKKPTPPVIAIPKSYSGFTDTVVMPTRVFAQIATGKKVADSDVKKFAAPFLDEKGKANELFKTALSHFAAKVGSSSYFVVG